MPEEKKRIPKFKYIEELYGYLEEEDEGSKFELLKKLADFSKERRAERLKKLRSST